MRWIMWDRKSKSDPPKEKKENEYKAQWWCYSETSEWECRPWSCWGEVHPSQSHKWPRSSNQPRSFKATKPCSKSITRMTDDDGGRGVIWVLNPTNMKQLMEEIWSYIDPNASNTCLKHGDTGFKGTNVRVKLLKQGWWGMLQNQGIEILNHWNGRL